MKIALVHDWLTVLAGAEKVLEAIYKIYPADIYTLVANSKNLENSVFRDARIFTSFIQKLPSSVKKYRNYLALFPLAIEQFDLSGYDIVISSSHAVAKGILKKPNQIHFSYVHTPIRYAWDLYHQYLRESGLEKGIKGFLAKLILHYIRMWDFSSADRVDYYIANSSYVAERIKRIYHRESAVIYPPVDIEKFQKNENKENFYLTASRMVPYKKIDLIVQAFAAMPERRLVVIGDGPDYKKIKQKATKNVELLGYQDDASLKSYLERAKAFVFAAEEDFGILPVEAQACGTPVIAFKKGGAAETVIDKKTGIFFNEQTENAVLEAVDKFENLENQFNFSIIRKNAERFSINRFQTEFQEFIENRIK